MKTSSESSIYLHKLNITYVDVICSSKLKKYDLSLGVKLYFNCRDMLFYDTTCTLTNHCGDI